MKYLYQLNWQFSLSHPPQITLEINAAAQFLLQELDSVKWLFPFMV